MITHYWCLSLLWRSYIFHRRQVYFHGKNAFLHDSSSFKLLYGSHIRMPLQNKYHNVECGDLNSAHYSTMVRGVLKWYVKKDPGRKPTCFHFWIVSWRVPGRFSLIFLQQQEAHSCPPVVIFKTSALLWNLSDHPLVLIDGARSQIGVEHVIFWYNGL